MRLFLIASMAFAFAACGSKDEGKFDGYYIEEKAAFDFRGSSKQATCSTESVPVIVQIKSDEIYFVSAGLSKTETKLGKVEADGKISYSDSEKAPPVDLSVKFEGNNLVLGYKWMDQEYPYLQYSKSTQKEVDEYHKAAQWCGR